MFIGHYAPALVAAAHPKAPGLGTLFVAAQLVDFAFFGFVLLGIEHLRIVPGITEMNALDLHHMPYTHSLVGGAVWGAGFGAIVYALTKNRTGALIAAAVVLSHWLIDLLVHRPDLTLAGSPPMLGLGLWNVPMVAMPLELLLIGGAFAYYVAATRAQGGGGWTPLIVLALLLIVVQMVDWFGPPPDEAGPQLALTALGAYAATAIAAWWAGRGRGPIKPSTESASSA